MKNNKLLGIGVVSLLTACGGGASNPPPLGNAGLPTAGQSTGDSNDFFTTRVAPKTAFCRSCHLPGGVADVDDGRGFMLSSNPAEDLFNMRASWQRLGGGIATNPILVQASDPAASHSGGQPWPVGSEIYRDVSALFSCWDDPASCDLNISGEVADELPLLGSSRARFVWEEFCETNDDSATLPVDPRTLVVPGVNQNRAVFFNAYFEECHDALPIADQAPRTCGEYKASRDRGEALLSGKKTPGSQSAEEYGRAWEAWGYDSRPENFDQLYTLRYGLNVAPYRNPYPLEGEDPNQTNGGSGQLPMGKHQTRDESGRWTGMIAEVPCFACHGGQIGDPYSGETPVLSERHIGLGNSNLDSPMSIEHAYRDPASVAFTVFNLGVKQRGQNNAVGAFEVLFAALDYDSLGVAPNMNKALLTEGQDFDHPTGVAQDTPAWWNYSQRPRKFFDAGQSIDSTRIVLAAHPNSSIGPDGTDYRKAIEEDDQDAAAYIASREAPAYPAAIDTELAEQGAILFHTKDLWAEPGNAEAPRPEGGNGSCASCHGAYSPRYVHDDSYLETPLLEGIAGHISELDVIGTDTARADTLTPYLRDAYSTTFWAYPDGAEGWVDPAEKLAAAEVADDALPIDMRPEGACSWERGVIGYQAPPLFGTWATAPYFHNGSVPNLEAVLDSSKRPAIWRRKLQTVGEVTGFDQRMSVAFDWNAIGWKHEVLACEDMPGGAAENCHPVDAEGPSLLQLVETFIWTNFNWAALGSASDATPSALEKRFIFDTRALGNGAGGHTFSDVLTDKERRAIIEYLKTL